MAGNLEGTLAGFQFVLEGLLKFLTVGLNQEGLLFQSQPERFTGGVQHSLDIFFVGQVDEPLIDIGGDAGRHAAA